MKKPMHVDDFISVGYLKDQYARWMLMHFRLPAALAIDFLPLLEGKKLFATFKGERYRVTGASRLGDVWLTSDFNKDTGYEHRVSVEELSDWSPNP